MSEVGHKLVQGFKNLQLVLSGTKSHFLASSSAIADRLTKAWQVYGFGHKVAVRSLGVDVHAGRVRRTPTTRMRLRKGAQRARRLRRLRAAGSKVGEIHRAGPQAGSMWGCSVAGLAGRQIVGLRRSALRSMFKEKSGASLGLKMRTSRKAAAMDPYVYYHVQVVLQWARAVWDGIVKIEVLECVLQKALSDLGRAKSKWAVATSPAHVLVLTLQEICWKPLSARLFQTRSGVIDLFHLSPVLVSKLAGDAVRERSDVDALKLRSGNQVWCRHILWDGVLQLCDGSLKPAWHEHHQNCLRSSLSFTTWTMDR
eukprot:9498313-Pyramimonas_sp.AAC.1